MRPESVEDFEERVTYRIVELGVIMGNAADLTVFPKRVKCIEGRTPIRLSQVIS